MNYYHGTTSVRPRVHCADGVSLSIRASKYNHCSPRRRIQQPWDFYTLVEVGYICDKNSKTFFPPDIWREYQYGKVQVWAYVPVSVVKEFIAEHGGEVEAPPAPWVEQVIE